MQHSELVHQLQQDVEPTGRMPSRIMVIGEGPDMHDVRKQAIFSGYTGSELSSALQQAGIHKASTYCTAVSLKFMQAGVDSLIAMKKADISINHLMLHDKFVLPSLIQMFERLKNEIRMCRPNVIICLGNVPFWLLTGQWGVAKWRGSMMKTIVDLGMGYTPKILPTYAPGMLLRMPEWRGIMVTDFKRALKMAQTQTLEKPAWNFVIQPTYHDCMSILTQLLDQLEKANRKLKLATDVETRAGHISCIGIAWSRLEALCIPLMCVERPEGYWNEQQEVFIIRMLHKILTHPNLEGVGQNFSYDMQYFSRWLLFHPRLVRDTMLGQHSMFANVQKALDFQASMYCEYYCYWKDDGKLWDPSKPERDQWFYNCTDCVYTYEIDDVQNGFNGQPGLIDQMRVRGPADFQNKLFWPVNATMEKGVRVDHKKRKEFAVELFDAIESRRNWINQAVGYDLNTGSPAQLKELFYEQMGFTPVKARGTGADSTNEESMRVLMAREPLLKPLVNRILEMRSLGVFLSTFVNAGLDIDGRLRCSYNIAGTETYRFASKKNAFGTGLNLQNVPSGGAIGEDGLRLPNIRSLIIPDEGKEFFDIDLNSADLRIVVWESDETEMKAMLAAGLDPYTEVAKEFYNDRSLTKKDPRRQLFKAFCHGTHYLGTAKGLAERLGLLVHEAERTQKWYFGKFPRIEKRQKDLIDQVHKRRMVENIFGYRYYIQGRIEGTVMNEVAAWIPQSTVGCLINRAYVAIHEQEPEIDILLQVHDSLAGQYDISRAEHFRQRVIDLAQIPLPYSDPLTIPVGIKTSTKSWGDCE